MRKYFGTDGIRRIANTELSPELVYKVAKAGAYVLSKHSDHTPTILIGRDTRISGTLIESAMVAGFLSYGANVKLLGVIPTPAVAYLTRKLNADASVVISASHNTYEFNGIKYFSNKGMKISDELEEEIEEVMESGKLEELTAENEKIGVSEYCLDLIDEYVYFFRKNFDDEIEKNLNDNFIVGIDTANGATSVVAEKVFKTLGIKYKIINNNPDGININDNCGSTHLEGLKKFVVENKLSLGIAYDGDGDRYVLEKMLKEGYNLGGEQSGHVILLDYNPTGDGILTSLMLIKTILEEKKKASELGDLIKLYPQVLINAKVNSEKKYDYEQNKDIKEAIEKLEKEFAGNGRVLIRPSGTEPLVRVMIEGEDQEYITKKAKDIAKLIEEKLK